MYLNPYYEPQALGLEIVGQAGWEQWGFSLFVVWKDADGTLFWSSDSGCSCKSPFDDLGLDGIGMTTGTPQQAHEALDAWTDENTLHENDIYVTSAVELHGKIADL